jgi:cellulose synthase/poly-beta-1,6-N-acetylglucosamine synthase-like glycosyltransferase
LLAIVMLWLVTPTPKKLYDPKLHSSADENYNAGSDDINNSIIVPSYNEAQNIPPLSVDCMHARKQIRDTNSC